MGPAFAAHTAAAPRRTAVAPTRSVTMTAQPIAEPIAATVASLMPRAKAELTELVAFRSVADPAQFPRSECEAAATWVA
ncbi:dipeptidase, partial [Streptomyces sp. Act-28]